MQSMITMLEDNGIMKQSQFILTSLLLLVSSFAWSANPIHNIVDESVPMMADGSSATLDDVKKAIIAGCQRKGWTAVLDGDAQI